MKKIYNKMLIIILLFITMPPYVESAVSSTKKVIRYNNYYYFVEPFGSGYQGKTVNKGIFASPAIGYSNEKSSIIPLCKVKNSNCNKTYEEFYRELNNLNSASKTTITVENKNCLINSSSKTVSSSSSLKEINTYYSHGCYATMNTNTGQWSPLKGTGTEYTTYNIPVSRCSSVNRDRGASVNALLREKGINDRNDYLELIITRPPLTIVSGTPSTGQVKKIESDFTPTNTSKCIEMAENEVDHYKNKSMYSPILANYSYDVVTYSCKYETEKKEPSCNNSSTIKENCQQQTIEFADVRADVQIEETGTITNILTPNIIYQGGGINISFIYYNTVKWDYYNKDKTFIYKNITKAQAEQKVIQEMKNKIYRKNEVSNNIKTKLTFDKGISTDYLQKINNNIRVNCEQSGNFNPGETVTTICTIFAPVSDLKAYTGEIEIKNDSSIDKGVNNKIYTELTYSGETNFSAEVKGLHILKNTNADWNVSFKNKNLSDKSCTIKIEDRLYEDNGNLLKYKFIYRPIDINNPFPNRNAGANWYAWYSNSYNKRELEETYSNMQYQVKLNPSTIKSIQDYNKGRNYLDWDSFKPGIEESTFIDNSFFTEKRINIKEGDN